MSSQITGKDLAWQKLLSTTYVVQGNVMFSNMSVLLSTGRWGYGHPFQGKGGNRVSLSRSCLGEGAGSACPGPVGEGAGSPCPGLVWRGLDSPCPGPVVTLLPPLPDRVRSGAVVGIAS